ncbi:MAG TPA: cytidylate kinase-like family protein [Gemmatimonadales bacterium]|nr:cytidylate kinase-like family protein [Gemmatimonadales bacterium]
MAVITISRQYASGGAEVAALAARRLDWNLIDNAFVERVADVAGMSPDEVARLEERVPSFVERLARALAGSSPELFLTAGDVITAETMGPEQHLVRLTEAVISEAVQRDRVVLVGRGAQAYIGERQGTLHVYVVAPRDVRVRRAAERHGIPLAEAERKVEETDDNRRRYVKTHYGRKWDDPATYDLVLNTAAFSYDEAATLLERVAALRGWR